MSLNYCNDSFSISYVQPLGNGSRPKDYTGIIAILSASFFCSVLGVILDITFICRIRTNFLVRIFVYLMISTTTNLGAFWGSYSIILISLSISRKSFDSWPWCTINIPLDSILVMYTMWVETLLICSINATFMTKVCSYSCCRVNIRTCWQSRIRSHSKCMEALFVTFLFGLPVLVTLTIGQTVSILNDTVIDNIIILFLPITPAFLSLVSVVFLIGWFCWLQIGQVVRVRMKTLLKEIGLFTGLLLTTFLTWILWIYMTHMYVSGPGQESDLNTKNILIMTTAFSAFLGIIPLCLFVYMWLSFRSSTRQVRVAQNENCNLRINPLTTGLQTAPPSTRVSLPSDTADHAPNFLSPSGDDLSEITPLLHNQT